MNERTENNADVINVSPPANSPDYAEELARKYYGIHGKVSQLACERDQILLLEETQGQRYILRFINPAEHPQVSDFQTQALLHVAEADPELPVPKVVPTLNGEGDVTVAAEDGRTCVVRLITCVPGIAASGLSARTPELHRDMGAKLARLDLALSDFSHPAAKYDLIWDLERADKIRDLLIHIRDEELREIATVALDEYKKNVLPVLPCLRRQIIHNDLNFSNVMVDGKNPGQVTGIIDFGDLIQGPIINEVAVSLSFQVGDKSDSLIPYACFLMSYHQTLPLETSELDILYDLILARIVMTIAISEWRITQFPENRDFILKNNPLARAGLFRLSNLGREKVQNMLFANCR